MTPSSPGSRGDAHVVRKIRLELFRVTIRRQEKIEAGIDQVAHLLGVEHTSGEMCEIGLGIEGSMRELLLVVTWRTKEAICSRSALTVDTPSPFTGRSHLSSTLIVPPGRLFSMVPRPRGVRVVCRTAQFSRVARKDPLKYEAIMEQVRRESRGLSPDTRCRRDPRSGGRLGVASLAVCAATIPFLPGLAGSRVFYVRDLTIFFWGRYLWLRHELLSGSFPLWDPYVGAGQSAVADALHQLFLLPAWRSG